MRPISKGSWRELALVTAVVFILIGLPPGNAAAGRSSSRDALLRRLRRKVDGGREVAVLGTEARASQRTHRPGSDAHGGAYFYEDSRGVVHRMTFAKYKQKMEALFDEISGAPLSKLNVALAKVQGLHMQAFNLKKGSEWTEEISNCYFGDCKSVPPRSRLELVTRRVQLLHCVAGKDVHFDCDYTYQQIHPCSTAGGHWKHPTYLLNVDNSQPPQRIDLPKSVEYICSPDQVGYSYSARAKLAGKGFPSAPVAEPFLLLPRYKKLFEGAVGMIKDLDNDLASYMKSVSTGAAKAQAALETVRDGAFATLVTLGSGGLVGAAGFTGTMAAGLTGALAGGVNAMIKSISRQLERLSLDPSQEFSWLELAGDIVRGAIVGAVLNYIGASVSAYLAGPAGKWVQIDPKAVAATGLSLKQHVANFLGNGAASVTREVYRYWNEVWWSSDGTLSDILESFNAGLFWERLIKAAFIGGFCGSTKFCTKQTTKEDTKIGNALIGAATSMNFNDG